MAENKIDIETIEDVAIDDKIEEHIEEVQPKRRGRKVKETVEEVAEPEATETTEEVVEEPVAVEVKPAQVESKAEAKHEASAARPIKYCKYKIPVYATPDLSVLVTRVDVIHLTGDKLGKFARCIYKTNYTTRVGYTPITPEIATLLPQ